MRRANGFSRNRPARMTMIGTSFGMSSAKLLRRPAAPSDTIDANRPILLSRSFARAQDGTRSRTITLRAFGRPVDDTNTAVVPVTLTFRGSATEFDSTMTLLAWTLIGSGVASGLIAAFAARRSPPAASRRCTRRRT